MSLCPDHAENVVERYCCCLCECYAPSLSLYVSHLRLVHGDDPSFCVVCGIDGCKEHFETFSGFNSHIYRHHRRAIGVDSTTGEEPEQDPDWTSPAHVSFSLTAVCLESGDHDDVDNISIHNKLSMHDLPDMQHIPGTTGTPVEETTEVSAAKFLLHMREGRHISQVAVADVIAGYKSLYKQSVEKLRYSVKEKLLQAEIDPETIDGVDSVLCEDPDPFQEIGTNYCFEKFCADHFDYLVCTCMHPYKYQYRLISAFR